MSQDRIWDALGDVGRCVDEDLLVEASALSRTTVRRYLRVWELAGYVHVNKHGGLGRSIEKLRGTELPYIYWDGKLAYAGDATVNFNLRPPTVHKHGRRS